MCRSITTVRGDISSSSRTPGGQRSRRGPGSGGPQSGAVTQAPAAEGCPPGNSVWGSRSSRVVGIAAGGLRSSTRSPAGGWYAVRLLFRPYSWASKGESGGHTARFCHIPADPALRGLPGARRWRPPDEVIGEHRPAAHLVVFVLVIQRPPAVPGRRRHLPGSLVRPQPGPPAFAVLPVPLRALAVTAGRAGQLGNGVQVGATAAPAAPGPLGQAVPGEPAAGRLAAPIAGPPGPPRRRALRPGRGPDRPGLPGRRARGTPGVPRRCGPLAGTAGGRCRRTRSGIRRAYLPPPGGLPASSAPQLERAWDAWQAGRYQRGEISQRARLHRQPVPATLTTTPCHRAHPGRSGNGTL